MIAEDGFHCCPVHCSFSFGFCHSSQGILIYNSFFPLFFSKTDRSEKETEVWNLVSFCFFLLHIFSVTKHKQSRHLLFRRWDRRVSRIETATQVCTAKRASRTESFGLDARVHSLWILLQRSVHLFVCLIIVLRFLWLCVCLTRFWLLCDWSIRSRVCPLIDIRG